MRFLLKTILFVSMLIECAEAVSFFKKIWSSKKEFGTFDISILVALPFIVMVQMLIVMFRYKTSLGEYYLPLFWMMGLMFYISFYKAARNQGVGFWEAAIFAGSAHRRGSLPGFPIYLAIGFVLILKATYRFYSN